MKAFAVLGILLGIMVMFMMNIDLDNHEDGRSKAVALNYAIYRNEGRDAPNRGIKFYFDASRVIPTAEENRPVNKAVRYLIRALP